MLSIFSPRDYSMYSPSTQVLLEACEPHYPEGPCYTRIYNVLKHSDEAPDINAFIHRGETPLIFAIRQQHFALVQLFLKNGADANFPDQHGNVPLIAAIHKARFHGGGATNTYAFSIVKWLLDYDANPQQEQGSDSPLSLAIKFDLTDVVELLLNQGANINKRIGKEQYSCLHYAILEHNVSMLTVLLNRYPNLELQNVQRQTPLIFSLFKFLTYEVFARPTEWLDCLAELIWAGAKTDITSLKGVVSDDHFSEADDIMTRLIEAKARVEMWNISEKEFEEELNLVKRRYRCSNLSF